MIEYGDSVWSYEHGHHAFVAGIGFTTGYLIERVRPDLALDREERDGIVYQEPRSLRDIDARDVAGYLGMGLYSEAFTELLELGGKLQTEIMGRPEWLTYSAAVALGKYAAVKDNQWRYRRGQEELEGLTNAVENHRLFEYGSPDK